MFKNPGGGTAPAADAHGRYYDNKSKQMQWRQNAIMTSFYHYGVIFDILYWILK